MKRSQNADADAAGDVQAFLCVGWPSDRGPNTWSRSQWLKGYQSTGVRSSYMSPGDYLEVRNIPNVAAHRSGADYYETAPKTVAFSEQQPTTSAYNTTPSYATISSARPGAGNRPAAAAGAATTGSGALPPPLLSPPHTLRSYSDTEPAYVSLDFRSTNDSGDRRDEERDYNNNDVCRRCRRLLQPDDGLDSEGVRPSFNNCIIYTLHIYNNKHHCEENYGNMSDKQQQRLRFERGQHQLQEQELQEEGDGGGVDNYVAFDERRNRLSTYENLYRRRRSRLS